MQSSLSQAEIEALLKGLPATEAQFLKVVHALEERGDRGPAHTLLERAVATQPTGALRRALAERCIHRRDYEAARRVCEEALRAAPDDAAAHLLHARALGGLGQAAAAHEALDRATRYGIAADRAAFWRSQLPAPGSGESPYSPLDDDELAPHEMTFVGGTELFELDDETTSPEALAMPAPAIPGPDRRSLELEIAADLDALGEADAHDETYVIPSEKVAAMRRSAAFAAVARAGDEDLLPDDDELTSAMVIPVAPPAHSPDAALEFQRSQGTSSVRISSPRDIETGPMPFEPSFGDLADLEDIELDYGDHGGATVPRDRPQSLPPATGGADFGADLDYADNLQIGARHQPGFPAMVREFTTSFRLDTPKFNWIRLFAVVGGVLLACTLALMLVTGYIESGRIDEALARADAARATDLYAGHVEALDAHERAGAAYSALGPRLDRVVFEWLPPVPGFNVAAKRAENLARTARQAALIELRFEQAGVRGSEARLERVARGNGADSPAATATRILQACAAGHPAAALALASEARRQHPADLDVLEAAAEAVLMAATTPATPADDAFARAVMGDLRALSKPTTYQHFLAARLSVYLDEPEATDALRTIVQEHSPEHVGARLELATALGDSDADAAMAALRSIVQNPAPASAFELARAHHDLGILLRDADQRDAAEDHLRKAIAAAPIRAASYPALVDLYLETARVDEARQLLTAVTTQMTREPYFPLTRARLFLLSGMPNQALGTLDELEDGGWEADWWRGHAYLDLPLEADAHKKAADAFEAAQRALDGKPNAAPVAAFAHFARALADAEQSGAASEALDKLVSEHGEDPDVRRAAALHQMTLATRAANRSGYNRSLDAAREHLDRALAIAPRDALLRYDLCRLDVLARDGERADTSCEAAREANPGYLRGMLDVARLRLLEGNPARAVALLEALRSRYPLDAPLSLLLARAYVGQGQVDRASDEVNRWLGQPAQGTVEWMLVEGHIALARGEYTRALGYYQRAFDEDRESGEAAASLGHVLVQLGHDERADPLLRDALSHPVYGVDAWFALGELRRRQGRLNDALTNLSRALQLADGKLGPPLRLARIHTALARVHQARHGARHALVARHVAQAREFGGEALADVHYLEGLIALNARPRDTARAERALRRATELDPAHCEAWRAHVSSLEGRRARQQAARVRTAMPASCREGG